MLAVLKLVYLSGTMEMKNEAVVTPSGDYMKLLPEKFENDYKKKCSDCLSDLTKFDLTEHGEACTEVVQDMDSESDESDSGNQPENYGDGVNENRFEAIQKILHNCIVATEKVPKKKPNHSAEKYLASILSICSKDQRKKLMKFKSDMHFDHVPLSLACKIRNLNVVKFLVEHCYAEVDGNEGNGLPLLWAVANQDEGIVKYLLEHGADAGKNAGANFNLLMYSMKIFLYKPFPLFGYGECADDSEKEDDSEEDSNDEQNQEDNKENDMPSDQGNKGEALPIPWFPKLKIVKMLINKGAVEKCSSEQLFEIFTTMTTMCNRDVINLGSPDELYEGVLKLLLKKKLDLANIRNEEECH